MSSNTMQTTISNLESTMISSSEPNISNSEPTVISVPEPAIMSVSEATNSLTSLTNGIYNLEFDESLQAIDESSINLYEMHWLNLKKTSFKK
ncbi:3193_t:CDS:2, partial [Dentiscutata erythropus]